MHCLNMHIAFMSMHMQDSDRIAILSQGFRCRLVKLHMLRRLCHPDVCQKSFQKVTSIGPSTGRVW